MSLKVTKTEAKKTVRRYSDAEKAQLLNAYQKLRNSDKTAQEAANAVNVPYITLRTWQRKREALVAPVVQGAPAKGTNAKRTKKAKASKVASGSVTLILPSGVRAEFSTPEDAARFLKAQS